MRRHIPCHISTTHFSPQQRHLAEKIGTGSHFDKGNRCCRNVNNKIEKVWSRFSYINNVRLNCIIEYTVPALLLTFVCFTCLSIKIYKLQYAWWLPYTKLQLSLNVHQIRFSLTSSIRVRLSGLRLYLQSDRDKTLQRRGIE